MNIFRGSLISKGFVSLFLVAGLFFVSNGASAATIYVDVAAVGANDGTSPVDAFTTIQMATLYLSQMARTR